MQQKQYEKIKKECHEFIQEVYQHQPRIMVFGEGNLHAPIAFVGEAPGAEETLQQHPFVGKAGKNLDSFLQAAHIARGSLYVTNVVKIRPVKVNEKTGKLSNRPPKKQEIDLFLPFLKRELELIRPKVVVSLGNVALQALLEERAAAIGKHHGRVERVRLVENQMALFPMYHPASIIYNPSLREIYLQDIAELSNYLEQQQISRE